MQEVLLNGFRVRIHHPVDYVQELVFEFSVAESPEVPYFIFLALIPFQSVQGVPVQSILVRVSNIKRRIHPGRPVLHIFPVFRVVSVLLERCTL